MADRTPFALSPIPRRARPPLPRPKPSLAGYLISEAGEPPQAIQLEPRLAAFLERLAAAGPDGIQGGSQDRLTLVHQLRAAGVPIKTTRVRRTDGGLGHIARYTLAGEVFHSSEGLVSRRSLDEK